MKKIIFCVTNDLTYDRRMIRICSALANAGFDIMLVGRKLPDSLVFSEQVFAQKRLTCFFKKGPAFYLEFNLRLFWFLMFKSVDIIGSVDDDTLLACGLASLFRRKKLTFDAHEYFTEVPELVNKKMIQTIWRLVEKLFIPRADLAYTVSANIADHYSKTYGKAFHTIMNLPDKIEMPTLNNFDKKIIIYQGALNMGRGIEELIDAMEKIEGYLWIVGEGDLSNILREQVKKKTYSHKIKFFGYLKPDELNAVTRQATLGYNVLQDLGLSYQYSLSNKFFDYIQNRIPSVSSDFIEYRHILAQYPVGITTTCNPNSIASDINKVMNDATYYLAMQSSCEVAAEVYHWQAEQIKLISLYRNV